MIFHNEIIKSIQNVFESTFATKVISDKTGISYTTVNELRNNKRDIYSTSVENCYALYSFAVAHKLNQKVLDSEKRKGAYDTINLNLRIEKVVVAFNRLDLFSIGYMAIKNSYSELKKDKLVQLDLSNSVFVTESKNCYDTYDFNEMFNCNYGGAGPNNFSRFVSKYSRISQNDIEEVIFNNEIVMYDYKNDKIKSIKNSIDSNGITLNTYNSKLIITIDKDKSDNYDLKYYFNKVKIITSILNEHYNKDTKLKRVSYIYSYESEGVRKYSVREGGINSIHYRIILEFDDFEIWIPHFVSRNNAFDTDEMKIFLNMIGIETKNSGFLENILKSLIKKHAEIEYIDIDTVV